MDISTVKIGDLRPDPANARTHDERNLDAIAKFLARFGQQKPVELAARAMRYSSLPGQNVLDLFGGSGSTLIAAEQTGRRCRGVEISPAYCDVIVLRWEEFTGKKAQRVEPGAAAA